ncbi:MAG: acylphosphatase [Nanoarchaeota archaeon]|nr:acylphosphatase [Nanoarchaeota archaeon]MBU4241622.1 acylphosphatase [Nanoarchaeota archaeon]MBU4352630.1 acylphosphatase [Nanoarchaeota archaeon]MBU4456379.1 acylphosphatase [Nanoarchaeota archaeon]MCG2719152.1 acylphosphatase [Nanoarchaeota archaeon]
MMKRVRIIISGDVQGVYFRANIKENAVMLDLNGFVRNLSDGSVEAVFEGEESDIEEIIDYCKEGPRGAKVLDVDVEEEEFEDEFEDFEVRD